MLVPLPVAPVQFRKRSTAWSLEGGVALDTLEILQCFRCPQSPRLPSFQFRERKTSCPLPSVVPSSTASGPRAAGPSAAFFVYCGDCLTFHIPSAPTIIPSTLFQSWMISCPGTAHLVIFHPTSNSLRILLTLTLLYFTKIIY